MNSQKDANECSGASSLLSGGRWNDSQLVSVSLAIQRDKGFEANVGILCPVCETESLDYEQFTIMDSVAWCRTCKTGYQQGRGEELARAR